MIHQTEETDPFKLQKKLNELYKSRRKMISEMKSALYQRRLMKEDVKMQQFQSEPSLANQDHKARESASSLVEHQPHLDTGKEEIKKAVSIHEGNRDRNKRMFGGINLHLRKAESKLQQEQSKIKEKISVERKIKEKEREEYSQFRSQKLREVEGKLQRLTKQKEESSAEILRAENNLLKQKFIAYVSDLNSYLFTSVQPSLSWRPAKPHPAISEAHQKQQEERNKEKERVVEGVVSYRQKFQYSKHTRENQKEYYHHILDSYFTAKSHFIATKTSPHLLWKPSPQGMEKCSALFAQTKASLQEEYSKIREENENHYVTILQKGQSEEEEIEEGESESDH